MEKKHSPLDWRFIERPNPEQSTIPFGIEKAYNSAVEPIADICSFPPINAIQLERKKANAELICTAVNSYYPMLEALKKASEVLDKVGYAYCKNHDGYATEDAVDNGWDDSIVEEMKSIIAKAENKQ